MRMSCNGCRVLRKGCSETCTIRPCLQWIRNPDSQANATVFLAKFYGRAGFMNLINSGPDHLRPAIFRSLLYEACGRIVNPIYGSVGLLWSGNWQLCQAAVEAVLAGAPIVPIASDAAASTPVPPLKAYDIRHVSKGQPSDELLHKVAKPTRTRFKRSAAQLAARSVDPVEPELFRHNWPAGSHESSGSHAACGADSRENESVFSLEAASDVSQGESDHQEDAGGVELDLTLGLELQHAARSPAADTARGETTCSWDADNTTMGIELKLAL